MGTGACISAPGGKTAAVLRGHEGGINAMCLSSDGAYLITGSEDSTCVVWETEKNSFVTRMEGHEQYVSCVAANNEWVLTGSADNTIRKWCIRDGKCVTIFTGHTSVINSILLHENEVFSASYDKTGRRWDLFTGDCLQVYEGHSRGVSPLLLVDLSKTVRRGSHFNTNSRRNSLISTLVRHKLLLITGSADNTARAWSMDSSSAVVVYRGHGSGVQCLAARDQELYTGSADSTARLWDVTTGQALRIFDGHQGAIVCMQVS